MGDKKGEQEMCVRTPVTAGVIVSVVAAVVALPA